MNIVQEKINPNDIIQQVQERTGIRWQIIAGPSRKKEVKHARFIAAAMLYHLADLTLQMTGLFLGGRDHTTILHEVHTLQSHIIYDDIRERVAHISPELLEVLDSLQAKKAAA